MKNQIILSVFILFSISAYGQIEERNDAINLKRDTLIRNMLVNVNINNFIGKTVGQLLENDTIGKYKEYWWTNEPPGKLASLNLSYARGLSLVIYAYPLKYTPSFSDKLEFDFELFKKEQIKKLEIDKDFFEENVRKRLGQAK